MTVRRCSKCKGIGHEDFTSSGSFKLYHCEVCESFLWDHDGMLKLLVFILKLTLFHLLARDQTNT